MVDVKREGVPKVKLQSRRRFFFVPTGAVDATAGFLMQEGGVYEFDPTDPRVTHYQAADLLVAPGDDLPADITAPKRRKRGKA